jgi:type IV pilus assembly protein PilC
MLSSGVEIRRAFRTAGRNSSDPRIRRRFGEIADSVSAGHEVTEALNSTGGAFPKLFVDIVNVGEKTGSLPEVLRSLAEHYDDQVRLRKMFLGAIAWPAFQLFAAIWVIAILIFVLGLIADTQGTEAIDILGLGLTGTRGAVIWLAATFGSLAGLFVLFKVVRSSLAGKGFLDPLLLRVPVLGGCLRSFAVARFSWAFALTQQAGMRIDHSVRAAFRATSNGAFINKAAEVWHRIDGGEELSEALRATGLFPATYLEQVEAAEHGGMVPETLERMSPELEHEARRSLSALVSAAAWVIWALVAGFIIYVVFAVFSFYLGMLQKAANF